MRTKFVISVVIISILNLLLFYVFFNMGEPLLAVILCLLVTIVISVYLFKWIIKPVEIMKKQLEEANEENMKSERIRSEFVANVSHELKTPLTSILGFIETLQDGAADDPELRTKFLDIVAIETSRLKRLIEDLLVLSDIETKINGTVYIFSELLDEGKKVSITVRDEGIGISKEHIERLFERFYRVDKSRSTKVGGTGLGLSIVKHIANLFEAELKVESEINKGSSFKVIFSVK